MSLTASLPVSVPDHPSQNASSGRLDPCTRFAAGLLLLVGILNVTGAFGHSQMLNLSDPVFGLPFRQLMLLLGAAQLLVAAVCLFTRKRALSLGLIVWLAVNFLVYRLGLWAEGWHQSCGFLLELLSPSLRIADLFECVSAALLLAGSGAALWFGKHAAAGTTHGKSLKLPCPSCGGHIKFPVENLGRRIPCPHCQTLITLRKTENLKTSCYFCKGHIEFPAHAIGRRIPCPHCKMDITLKEPA